MYIYKWMSIFSYQSLAYGDKRRLILKVLLSYAYQQLNVTKYNNY